MSVAESTINTMKHQMNDSLSKISADVQNIKDTAATPKAPEPYYYDYSDNEEVSPLQGTTVLENIDPVVLAEKEQKPTTNLYGEMEFNDLRPTKVGGDTVGVRWTKNGNLEYRVGAGTYQPTTME